MWERSGPIARDSDARRWSGRSITQISDEKFAPKRTGNARNTCGRWRKMVGFKGYDGVMVGDDLGSFRWLGAGIFEWCRFV